MGSIDDNEAHGRRVHRLKIGAQAAILVYVVLYAACYKNTHLRTEKVTGNVYIDAWEDRAGKDAAAFAQLPYCREQAAASITRGTCLTAMSDTQIFNVTGKWTVTGRVPRGNNVKATGPVKDIRGYQMVGIQPEGSVLLDSMEICESRDSEGDGVRRCGYVNEIDLFSFKEGNFIPTFVQVVHQKASCVDGSADLDSCQIDYKTTPDSQQEIDEYFIGFVENYKVQITHAFQSETFGQRTMDEAEHFGIPDCVKHVQQQGPICYDSDDGGHDLSTVKSLLSAVKLTLSSNNDETNHVGHRETFRTSGMKLHVHIRYSNTREWWAWTGLGTVGYRYEVQVVPAQSVWRSLTVRRKEDMRIWTSAAKLVNFGKYDRMLVWADGIDIKAYVSGNFGFLDFTSLLVMLASALPLMYITKSLVECIAERTARSSRYESMSLEEARATSSRCPLSAAEESARDVAPL